MCAANFEKKASNIHIHSMCGSSNGFLHPWINGRELIHWMKRGAPVEIHRDIFGLKTLGGKFFYFCNNSFVVTDIVLTCEQQQRLILQLLYTSRIHAHEVHSDFHVLEKFEVKQYEDQALAWFLRDYELPLGKCCTILEEAHDHTVTQKTNGGICGSIILIDEHCRDLAHNSSPHTSISATSCGDENWVKGFFMLVPCE